MVLFYKGVFDKMIRQDMDYIIKHAIETALPQTAVQKALENEVFDKGRLILVAIGKAAWSMAEAASKMLQDQISEGVLITKYDHAMGDIKNIKIFEAGHPISDDNTYRATKYALNLVDNLSEEDTVLFLISGGGSALFEDPLISKKELEDINQQLLASGASIVEINTIRKRLSRVKGGKFAKLCEPAQVLSVVLSDIIDDPLDMIASGPAYPDDSTVEDAKRIIEHYNLQLTESTKDIILKGNSPILNNVRTKVTGSVQQLCDSAEKSCEKLGYKPIVLTASLDCEAKEAGKFLGAIAKYHHKTKENLAFIAGGETIVQLRGDGKGGRNQELALAAAPYIADLDNVTIFSFGSDGTDGPTDAAGAYVDGTTLLKLQALNIDVDEVLANNDSYHALKAVDNLVMTGPTGTNVNDLSVVLIKAK